MPTEKDIERALNAPHVTRPMVITLNTVEYSKEFLTALANALSTEIDEYAKEPSHPEEHPHRIKLHETFVWQFNMVCKDLESRGVVLSDAVRCPEYA